MAQFLFCWRAKIYWNAYNLRLRLVPDDCYAVGTNFPHNQQVTEKLMLHMQFLQKLILPSYQRISDDTGFTLSQKMPL